MPVYSKILAWTPSIKVSADKIVATTSLWFQVVNLGTFRRQVTIDSRTRTIRIQGRFFWVFTGARTVAFNEVSGVLYTHHESGGGSSYFTGESEGADNYHVGLRLRTMEEVPLFTFSGESEYVSHTTDVLDLPKVLIETALDAAGTQHEESLEFIDLLCERIGVPLAL